MARIRINAFRIELAGGLYEDLLASAVASVEAEAAVGNAVYLLPSFYNHDCGEHNFLVFFLDFYYSYTDFLFFHLLVAWLIYPYGSDSLNYSSNSDDWKQEKCNFNNLHNMLGNQELKWQRKERGLLNRMRGIENRRNNSPPRIFPS